MYYAILTVLSAAAACAAEFTVAPDGNDANPGTRAQPFATFQRAQAAVRAELASHPDRGVTVTFRGGVYRLDHTLELTPADSGPSADRPVCYRAEPGAEVVISGGRRIAAWQPDARRPGVWRSRVVEPRPGDPPAWVFQQLWVNDQRATRARTPDTWQFSLLQGVVEDAPKDNPSAPARHTFTAAPQSLSALRGLDGGGATRRAQPSATRLSSTTFTISATVS